MRVVAYARFSTDKQSDASIDDQLRNCTRYAERQGWGIAQHYEDRAVTGATRARSGYQDMLAAAERKEFDVLLVDDLSRLARDEVEMKQVIRRFKFRGTRIIGVSDGYDSSTKGEKIQATMRGLMNEIYIDDLRDKTHRGMTGKALEGYCTGGRTYGYKTISIPHPTKLDSYSRPEIMAVKRDIDDEQAKVVRRIFDWFAKGRSPKWIAGELNRLGIPSPRSSTWCPSAIYGEISEGTGVLNNPLYNGQAVWNRSQWGKDPDTGKRRRLARPQEEWIITPMPELRIVSEQLWEAVQARQAEIRNKSTAMKVVLGNPKTRSRPGKYLLSGLLKCGCCGANYTVHSNTSYGCSFNINRGDAACANRMRISRRVIEETLLETVYDDLYADDSVALFVKELETLLHQQQKRENPDLDANRRALEKVELKITNLVAAIENGGFNQVIRAALDKAEGEKAHLTAAVKVENVILDSVESFLPDAAGRYKQVVSSLRTTLQNDIVEAHQYLKTLIGTVTLHPQPDGYLMAYVKNSVEGLVSLALGDKLKARMVAGARYALNPTGFPSSHCPKIAPRLPSARA